jgi:hypothetical protein
MPIIQSTATVGSDGVKVLVYGKSGVGKTVLCSTAPAPIIISAESGLLSLRKLKTPVPFIEVKNYSQLIDAFNWASGSREASQFYTICLDSLSEMGEVILTEELRKNKDPRKAYGELTVQVLAMVKGFRDIKGKSCMIVAKEEYDKDEGQNIMLYGPSLPGKKSGPQLPYLFDEVFQLLVGKDPQTNQDWRGLRTKPTFQHVAKDRSGVLDEFEPANLTHVFKKILTA